MFWTIVAAVIVAQVLQRIAHLLLVVLQNALEED